MLALSPPSCSCSSSSSVLVVVVALVLDPSSDATRATPADCILHSSLFHPGIPIRSPNEDDGDDDHEDEDEDEHERDCEKDRIMPRRGCSPSISARGSAPTV